MEKVNKKLFWVKLKAKKQGPYPRHELTDAGIYGLKGTSVKVIRNKECDALNISCTDAELKMETAKHFY